MAVTPFRAVSWQSNDLITESKMNRMASNDNWLRDNTPRALYRGPGGNRHASHIKIVGGTCLIHARKKGQAHNEVRFNEFFSGSCDPIVTTGVASTHQRRFFVTFNGFGRLHPDRRGFRIFVQVDAKNKKANRIQRNIHVHWHAIGY